MLNKTTLTEQIAENHKLSKAEAGRIVNEILNTIMDAATTDGAVFTGFGSFKTVNTAARTARNPRTGEKINVPAGKKIKFSAGSEFKSRIK